MPVRSWRSHLISSLEQPVVPVASQTAQRSALEAVLDIVLLAVFLFFRLLIFAFALFFFLAYCFRQVVLIYWDLRRYDGMKLKRSPNKRKAIFVLDDPGRLCVYALGYPLHSIIFRLLGIALA